MQLNDLADHLEPRDLTASDEFRSLLASATDLGIPHSSGVRYRSRHTVVRRIRLHFLEWGDDAAPPVLLLHGGGQTAHSWDLVSLHLADRYHVLALDQRGHGDSEWVRDRDYSAQAMAEDALAFIDQQRLHAPVIIGHSMGGRNAMQLALARPGAARAFVFVDVGPEMVVEGARAIRDFVTANVEFDTIEQFVERVQAYDGLRTREHIERTARYNLFRRADGKYVSKSDRVLHERARDADGIENGAGAGQPTVPGARFATITLAQARAIDAPALILRGEHSPVFTRDLAQAFADALPHGRWLEVARAGHNVHSQNTPGFLEALWPFLRALPGA